MWHPACWHPAVYPLFIKTDQWCLCAVRESLPRPWEKLPNHSQWAFLALYAKVGRGKVMEMSRVPLFFGYRLFYTGKKLMHCPFKLTFLVIISLLMDASIYVVYFIKLQFVVLLFCVHFELTFFSHCRIKNGNCVTGLPEIYCKNYIKNKGTWSCFSNSLACSNTGGWRGSRTSVDVAEPKTGNVFAPQSVNLTLCGLGYAQMNIEEAQDCESVDRTYWHSHSLARCIKGAFVKAA